MTQSRYSVMISLLLLLLLTAGFFFATRAAYNALHTRVEAALATATVVVVPATPTRPPVSPTPKGGNHTHTQPLPTDTPSSGTVQVQIGTSASAGSAGTTFPSSVNRYYCMANLPNLPADTPISFTWKSMPSQSEITTYTWNPPTAFKFSYLDGSLAPGQYRCQISAPVNGSAQVLGAALFTVR